MQKISHHLLHAPNHQHLEQNVIGMSLGRPKGAERVYGAEEDFALKGQKH